MRTKTTEAPDWVRVDRAVVVIGPACFVLTVAPMPATALYQWAVEIPSLGLRWPEVLKGTAPERTAAQAAAEYALRRWIRRNLPLAVDAVMPRDVRPRGRAPAMGRLTSRRA